MVRAAIDPECQISLSQAVELFFEAKRSERLSEHTLADYAVTLRRWQAYAGPQTPLSQISPSQARSFIGSLPVSKKTAKNAHVALSSLWSWAVSDGYAVDHIMRRVTPPKPEVRVIVPYRREELEWMMDSPGAPPLRNRALILFLLDTGVRASEVGTVRIGDLRGLSVVVYGKGDKEREIPLSPRTLRAMLAYLATRRRQTVKEPLFSTRDGKPMDRHAIRSWLERMGERIGVAGLCCHRFRHTFAINYLRNGGDAISLQRMLGHTTLDMVRRYTEMTQDDLAAIHRRASPVENWGL